MGGLGFTHCNKKKSAVWMAIAVTRLPCLNHESFWFKPVDLTVLASSLGSPSKTKQKQTKKTTTNKQNIYKYTHIYIIIVENTPPPKKKTKKTKKKTRKTMHVRREKGEMRRFRVSNCNIHFFFVGGWSGMLVYFSPPYVEFNFLVITK